MRHSGLERIMGCMERGGGEEEQMHVRKKRHTHGRGRCRQPLSGAADKCNGESGMSAVMMAMAVAMTKRERYNPGDEPEK